MLVHTFIFIVKVPTHTIPHENANTNTLNNDVFPCKCVCVKTKQRHFFKVAHWGKEFDC